MAGRCIRKPYKNLKYKKLKCTTVEIIQNNTIQNIICKIRYKIRKKVSWQLGVLSLVDEASFGWKETVLMMWGFGPDRPQPPARGEWLEQCVSRVGGIGHNIFSSHRDLEVCRSLRDVRRVTLSCFLPFIPNRDQRQSPFSAERIKMKINLVIDNDHLQ